MGALTTRAPWRGRRSSEGAASGRTRRLLVTALLAVLVVLGLGAPIVGAQPAAASPAASTVAGGRADAVDDPGGTVVGAETSGPSQPRVAHLASPTTPQPTAHLEVTLTDPTRWTPWRGATPAHLGRTLPTLVVYPTSPGPWPVVGFAHGFATAPRDYVALLDRVASAGYVVVAPEFPIGGIDGDGVPRRDDLPEQPADLSLALSWAVGAGVDPSSPLAGRVDGDRIGAFGHSDGGITVAAMAEHTATLDPRLRGTAVLAGETWPIPGGSWGPVNRGAVLVVQGDADLVNPWWKGRQPYDLAGAPRVFSTVVGGSHWAPYVDGPEAPVVQAELVAFLDATVRGDVTGRARLAAASATPPLVSELVGLSADPFGNLESTRDAATGATVLRGWVADPDAPGGSLGVHVYVDGRFAAAGVADQPRPDVSAAFTELGPATGFVIPLPDLADGTRHVCVYGLDIGAGENATIGCATVQVAHQPFGNLESTVVAGVGGGGTVTLTGWAVDPDAADPVEVHVYVDGVGAAIAAADLARPDVAAAFPGAGPMHGFRVSVAPAGDGVHQVCVYARNVGAGAANTTLGCRAVTVPHGPFGNLEVAAPPGPSPAGLVELRGWAVDPDTTGPVPIHVYIDGVGAGVFLADAARPDVAAAVPGAGPSHGFVGSISVATQGTHQVCVYAVNVGAGTANTTLGCRSFVVDRTAFGALDDVAVIGGGVAATARVTGWAIDPDTSAPSDVHVYVDGRLVAAVAAFGYRPDLAAAFAAYGPVHGYDEVVALGPGAHQVCVYAIDAGQGRGNQTLGCRIVVAAG